MKKILAVVFCLVALAFSQEAADTVNTETSALRQELSVRDSVMQVRDSLCGVEKDSLRTAVVIEQAKCANWEQSYQTVKKDNEVCAQALGVAIEANQRDKDSAAEERKKAAVMSSSSFFGGLLVGGLLFWLIFD